MNAHDSGMTSPLRPITLHFRDPPLERAYRRAAYPRALAHGRTAILVGIFVYLLCGLLDHWHVPDAAKAGVWQARLTALMVPTVVMLVSFTALFRRYAQLWLTSVSLAAGLGLIAIQAQVPLESSAYYYPAMVMVTFYTYNFIGVRFPYALAIDALLLVSYNLIFGGLLDYPGHILFGHDVFIISANLIGGTTGYLAERQGRLLYLKETQLEEERHYHRQRSLHDPLTGLPNRELLYDRIAQAMASSRHYSGLQGGLFIDLDGFKRLNDRLGHRVGDQVLIQIAERLRNCVRDVDTVARIGGDEFFVLARDLASEQDVHRLADQLLDCMRIPLADMPEPTQLQGSIGVCLFPYPDMSVADIIHRADTAMYEVKSAHKNGYRIASAPA